MVGLPPLVGIVVLDFVIANQQFEYLETDRCVSSAFRPLRRDFRRTWTSACEHVGISGFLFHDLRRTAARQGAGLASPKR